MGEDAGGAPHSRHATSLLSTAGRGGGGGADAWRGRGVGRGGGRRGGGRGSHLGKARAGSGGNGGDGAIVAVTVAPRSHQGGCVDADATCYASAGCHACDFTPNASTRAALRPRFGSVCGARGAAQFVVRYVNDADQVVALVASSGFVEGAQVAAALEASREKLAMGGGGVASHAPACDALRCEAGAAPGASGPELRVAAQPGDAIYFSLGAAAANALHPFWLTVQCAAARRGGGKLGRAGATAAAAQTVEPWGLPSPNGASASPLSSSPSSQQEQRQAQMRAHGRGSPVVDPPALHAVSGRRRAGAGSRAAAPLQPTHELGPIDGPPHAPAQHVWRPGKKTRRVQPVS